MITQYDVHAFLEEKIPQLNLKTYPLESSMEVYTCINDFTAFTKELLEEHKYNHAKNCLAVAENLYLHGDDIVHQLIENTFMFSISAFVNKSRSGIYMINCILPGTLYEVYKKQVLHDPIEKIFHKN